MAQLVPLGPPTDTFSVQLVGSITSAKQHSAHEAQYAAANWPLCADSLRATVEIQEIFDRALPHTRAVNTTPQMTRFRGARVCSKWQQGKVMRN